jgi:outer membrane protein OmpA-like peptidoglycan-associated protein
MKTRFILLTLFTLFFVACAPKTTVVLLDSGKSQNAIIVANEKGQTRLDKVGSYVDLKDKTESISKIKVMSKDELNDRFSKVLAVVPLKPITYIVYFKPNSTELTEASKVTLNKALKSIKSRSPCTVDIIGHTDTVGSSAMNTKVSLKRAKSIELLVKQSKIKILALVAKGYGEEDLLVKTKNNKAEAKNRNVEIFIK